MKRIKVTVLYIFILSLLSLGIPNNANANSYCGGPCNELYCVRDNPEGICWSCACDATIATNCDVYGKNCSNLCLDKEDEDCYRTAPEWFDE